MTLDTDNDAVSANEQAHDERKRQIVNMAQADTSKLRQEYADGAITPYALTISMEATWYAARCEVVKVDKATK